MEFWHHITKSDRLIGLVKVGFNLVKEITIRLIKLIIWFVVMAKG